MRTARMTMIIALSVVAVALPTAAGACDPADVTVKVTWLMPVPQGGWTSSPDAGSATWPQTLATGDECGNSWFQVDDYLGLQSVIDAILADGQLILGEDSSVVQSWSFVEQQPCPTPTPPPPPELEQEIEVPSGGETFVPPPSGGETFVPPPSGGETFVPPPVIVPAAAAVPVAASPRFTG